MLRVKAKKLNIEFDIRYDWLLINFKSKYGSTFVTLNII